MILWAWVSGLLGGRELDQKLPERSKALRIVILDLKWSYGIEVLREQLMRYLGKDAEVLTICGRKPYFPHGSEAATQGNYGKTALALINPLAYSSMLVKIREIEPEVIYFISPHVMNVPLVLLCKWFTNAVVISHIHDPEHAGSPLVATVANMVAMLQSRRSHRVYCWGEAIKETISLKFGIPPGRIAVFRHGPGHKTPADDSDGVVAAKPSKYFSMIGTMIPRKGIEYYLEAARLFNERHGADATQFLLAGSGDLTRYKDAMERLPNLVVLNRFLEDAEVNDLLANSYASVLPYTAGVMQSSFIAIAYGNGCPVIVSNIGSLPEEVENGVTGYVVEKANAEQIATAMTKIYTDTIRMRMKSDCVAVYREKFRWHAIAGEMYRDMENCVGNRRNDIYLGREVRESQR